jgi:hypothetical protein
VALTVDRTLSSGVQIKDAYAWISNLNLDLRQGGGLIVLDVHPSEEHWQKPPAEQILIRFGQQFPDGSEFPTLATALADPVVAEAYAKLGEALYYMIATTHPLFRTAGGR